VLVVALAGCGGSDAGESTPKRAGSHIGESRVATSEPRGDQEPGERSGGIVQRKPSVGGLDRSDPPESLESGRRGCSGGRLEATRANLRKVGRATLCLLNLERSIRRTPRLRSNPRLTRAALGHSRDMVRKSYFAHDSRSGSTFMDRIRRGGYLRGAAQWTLGENIGWGTGATGTPQSMVGAWMKSPPHRASILNRTFKEVGVGVALGTPIAGADRPGATYNTDFGTARGGKR